MLIIYQKILLTIREKSPDILWVDNKPFIQLSTLKKIRDFSPFIKIINLITDDATGKLKYAWRLCLKTAFLYDYHFVQRRVNISELKLHGARRVHLCYRSFDPSFHRPVVLSESDYKKFHCSVGFIGTYEADREESVAFLIESGIMVTVTGDGWPKGKYWNVIKPFYRGPSVYGEEYIKHLNGMDIALHFLRHGNRDEQDSRTFELPACGVFMLAENSELHRSLFEADTEAVFFHSKEELLLKTKYYLEHPGERKGIAEKGYLRSIKSGYDHTNRLKKVIEQISG